jgi:hypothetical protein
MIGFSLNLGKNFAFDLTGPRLIRRFKDGVTFFDFLVSLDLYASDHKPSFDISLIFLNLMFFEINIYNVHHERV